MKSQADLHKMVREIARTEGGLTGWELDFIDDVSDWDGDFSEKQAEVIERIWNKLFK